MFLTVPATLGHGISTAFSLAWHGFVLPCVESHGKLVHCGSFLADSERRLGAKELKIVGMVCKPVVFLPLN